MSKVKPIVTRNAAQPAPALDLGVGFVVDAVLGNWPRPASPSFAAEKRGRRKCHPYRILQGCRECDRPAWDGEANLAAE